MAEEVACTGENKSNFEPGHELREDDNVQASLKFLQWQSLYEVEKPFQIFINIPDHVKDRRTTNLVFEDCQVMIKDVRGHSHDFTLDYHGFMYRIHETSMKNVTDRKY